MSDEGTESALNSRQDYVESGRRTGNRRGVAAKLQLKGKEKNEKAYHYFSS